MLSLIISPDSGKLRWTLSFVNNTSPRNNRILKWVEGMIREIPPSAQHKKSISDIYFTAVQMQNLIFSGGQRKMDQPSSEIFGRAFVPNERMLIVELDLRFAR